MAYINANHNLNDDYGDDKEYHHRGYGSFAHTSFGFKEDHGDIENHKQLKLKNK